MSSQTLDYYKSPNFSAKTKLMFLVSNFYSPQTEDEHAELVRHIEACLKGIELEDE